MALKKYQINVITQTHIRYTVGIKLKNMNPTQTNIWDNVLKFNLDQPISEYNFSTRLAYENGWSLSFTQRAIEEYKRFMFLATISPEVVSPSPLVEVVWHQHLIYTQSYHEFCEILGKQIIHTPSIHTHSEKNSFEQTGKHTLALYRQFWGEPPKDIWLDSVFLKPLQNPKLLVSFEPNVYYMLIVVAGLMAFMPFYWLTSPFIMKINNPDFLIGYWIGFVAVLGCLFWYGSAYLHNFALQLYKENILQKLSPLELILMKRDKTADIIHGVMNQLVTTNKIRVDVDNSIKLIATSKDAENTYEFTILQTLEASGGSVYYPVLLGILLKKEVFLQSQNFIQEFKAKIMQRYSYIKLSAQSVFVFTLFSLFGFVRLTTGLLREKQVEYLVLSLALMCVFSIVFVVHIKRYFFEIVIPNLYRNNFYENEKAQDFTYDWQWQYFIVGAAFLEASFTPLVEHVERTKEADGGGSSSCGSSCGGGGCGGGCGGCGG